MQQKLLIVFVLILIGLFVPGVCALNVVTTMPNVYDAVNQVGGDKVTAIYVMPAAGVHLTPEAVDALLQTNSDFIRTADAFIAQGGSMDTANGITKVTDFRQANFESATIWHQISDKNSVSLGNGLGVGTNVYNDPENLKQYAAVVCSFLIELDPANTTSYLLNWDNYCDEIDRVTELTEEEEEVLSGTPVIRHQYMAEQTVTWMNMTTVATFTNAASTGTIIDAINANPETYKQIARNSEAGRIFVVENGVAGPENGKLIYEALQDKGVPSARVIFQNLPKMASGVDTTLDFYLYNKNLIFNEIKSGMPKLKIVTTMPNVWDVTNEVGGDYVQTIYVVPSAGVHLTPEAVDALLQTNSDFIKNADAFFAQSGMDNTGIDKVTTFRQANFGAATTWHKITDKNEVSLGNGLGDGSNVYNEPEKLKQYAAVVCSFLIELDPKHTEKYLENWDAYCNKVDSVTALTSGEEAALAGTPVIRHYYMDSQAEVWLGMNTVGTFTSAESSGTIINDIIANPDKYLAYAEDSRTGKIFVIENGVAGPENGKLIYEALLDAGVPAERAVFQNLPKMVSGVDSILDFYLYNKQLILPLVNYQMSSGTDSASSSSFGNSEGIFTLGNSLTVELSPSGTGLPEGTRLVLGDVPAGIPDTGFTTHQTMEIHLENAGAADISGAIIDFSIPTALIGMAGFGQYDVSLMRLVDDEWTQLPTTFSHEALGATYYSAETPGFSVFAIVYIQGATGEAKPKDSNDEPELKPIDATQTTVVQTATQTEAETIVPIVPTGAEAPLPFAGILIGFAAASYAAVRLRP